jgi:hypothetical protein
MSFACALILSQHEPKLLRQCLESFALKIHYPIERLRFSFWLPDSFTSIEIERIFELGEYVCATGKNVIVINVVKVKSTNSTKTLETNLNGNKQMIPSERAQKTVKNEPKNIQNH